IATTGGVVGPASKPGQAPLRRGRAVWAARLFVGFAAHQRPGSRAILPALAEPSGTRPGGGRGASQHAQRLFWHCQLRPFRDDSQGIVEPGRRTPGAGQDGDWGTHRNLVPCGLANPPCKGPNYANAFAITSPAFSVSRSFRPL